MHLDLTLTAHGIRKDSVRGAALGKGGELIVTWKQAGAKDTRDIHIHFPDAQQAAAAKKSLSAKPA
ncbi:MAG: hypothetical protein DI551_05405 [Micavibrio aeruginosavorus]|uniref:Uncharacterized protein n=1 Tax=Micavibrio aeruginosavorus TaxID=349221 RepID=A0A2W5MYD9_9BACT|nr:MAG: hypothetical protein DI551_05405 [Micavibrio aeruginosavorus]